LALVPSLVQASLALLSLIRKEKPPVPSRFLCAFNHRDLFKLYQGTLTVGRGSDCKAVAKFWAHEATRVFSDRMLVDEDRDWFEKTIAGLVQKHFSVKVT